MFRFGTMSLSKAVLFSAVISNEVGFPLYLYTSIIIEQPTDQFGLGISVGEFDCKTSVTSGWMVFTRMLHVRVQHEVQY